MQQILPILIPILALILGLLVLAALWYWWTSGQPETPPQGTEQGADQGPNDQPAQTPASTGDFETRLKGIWSAVKSGVSGLATTAASIEVRRVEPGGGISGSAEMIEVLRLYRDLSNGSLVVQIGRQKYYSLEQIGDPQVRRRFLGNAEAMAQFAQLKKGTSPLIDWSSAPSPSTEPEPAPPVQYQMGPSGQSSAPPPAPPHPMENKPFAAETAKDKEGKEAKDAPKPKSMADEIEELLQYRLALDPNFSRRSIHIRSAEDGSIFVEVDGTTFDGIGDVSDEEVRSFLQRIVQEWEARK